MVQSVAKRLLALAVTAFALLFTWPSAEQTTSVEFPDSETAGQASGDESVIDGPENEGGVDGAENPDGPESGASSSRPSSSGGGAEAFRNESGTYFSTLGAPDDALAWMGSSQILFNRPLPQDTPTVSNSDVIASHINEIIRGDRLYSYGSGIEEDRNAPHIVLVDSDREQFTPIVFRPQDCGSDTWWGWGPDEFEPYINGAYADIGAVGVPLPPDFRMHSDDSDFHLMIYDWRRDVLIELWRAKPNNITGRPGIEVCWGGVTKDYAAGGTGVFPFPVGVTASGMSSAGLTITLEDLRRGEINHAIGVSSEIAIDNQQGTDFSFPATRNDGICSSRQPPPDAYHAHVADSMGGAENCLLEGQYMRLPLDYDVDSITHPYARMIAIAARDYGLVLQDVAGCFCFQAESGRTATDNGFGSEDPWGAFYDGTPDWEVLWQIDWSRLEILPPDWNRPSDYQIPCAIAPGRSAATNPMGSDPRCQLPSDPYLTG
ncbi:MAG: hypothetical protein GY724_23780 [Actinomycetia bacterium]|nr:hypothetical protein [Actinomycetes bacterium]MCP5031702.1 hypothetical protein [Actinomycetes bacterium]